jgi:hypothetical protein
MTGSAEAPAARPATPRPWRWWVQLGLAAAVLAFLVPAFARQWDEFRALRVAVHLAPSWLGLSMAIVLATYLLQVESWRRVLAGWGQQLPFGIAVRAWCLSNLARYLPGKVWSVAGLVVLVQRAGVAPWAATASAVVAQALALATGIVAVAWAVPGIGHGLLLGIALAVATLVLLAMGSAKLMRFAGRIVPGAGLRPLPLSAVFAGGLLMLAAWVGYGAAFWALARGIGVTGLDLPDAVGLFTAGYIVGWLVLFAPAGVGAREFTLLNLLTPVVGAGGAVALTVASRLALTITEVAAAGLAVLLGRRAASPPDRTR